MNKKESAQILAILKASYPNFYKNLTAEEAQGTITVWSMQFADMPAEIVLMALNKVISTSQYPPTIAEVKKKITAIHWEAYDYISLSPTDNEQYQYYKRIYEATEGYKFASRIEPTVTQLITPKLKQLEKG